jgi:hypothetical protein
MKISLLFKFIIICVLLLSLGSCANAKTVTATWTQREIDVSRENFGGWEIYISDSENGVYQLWTTVPFSGKMTSYSIQKNISVSKDSTRWFKALAYNKDGEKSPFSNTSAITLTGGKKNPVIFKMMLEGEK